MPTLSAHPHCLMMLGSRVAMRTPFFRKLAGEVESDDFNRLVVLARLPAVEIVVLRAYAKYLRQAGLRFTDAYLADVLSAGSD